MLVPAEIYTVAQINVFCIKFKTPCRVSKKAHNCKMWLKPIFCVSNGFWIISIYYWGILSHYSNRGSRSSIFLTRRLLACLPNLSQTCSIGFRSGLLVGQLSCSLILRNFAQRWLYAPRIIVHKKEICWRYNEIFQLGPVTIWI